MVQQLSQALNLSIIAPDSYTSTSSVEECRAVTLILAVHHDERSAVQESHRNFFC
jgi:hypothetical protein